MNRLPLLVSTLVLGFMATHSQAEGLIYHEELFNQETELARVGFSSMEIQQISPSELNQAEGVFEFFSEADADDRRLKVDMGVMEILPSDQSQSDGEIDVFDIMEINV